MKTKALIPALLVTCGLAVSGCETLTETFAFDAIPRATFGDTVIGEAAKKEWKITDRIILSYADDVQKFMRQRMSGKRILRKASASIQVMTAAIAAALTGFGGPAAVIAGFAGVSAIIPEFQAIFQAAGGAGAFGRGAELIGLAKTDYIIAISKKGGQVQGALTPEGADLYKRVVASIVVVEKALLQQIPTRKQIEDAEGDTATVNNSPVVTAGGTLTYDAAAGAPVTAIDNTVTVTDVDSTNLTGATVQITVGFAPGEDVLGFTGPAPINGSYNPTTGLLTLTGTDTLANYQAALRAVTYQNNSGSALSPDRTIAFQVDDGSGANNLSNVATSTITP
jgi:hypothetical protein